MILCSISRLSMTHEANSNYCNCDTGAPHVYDDVTYVYDDVTHCANSNDCNCDTEHVTEHDTDHNSL